MRWIGRFVAYVWHMSRTSWATVHEDLRPRSAASGLVLFLFLMFFFVGLILVLLGIDLDGVDLWLGDHAHWFDAVGSGLFRLVCGFVLAMSALLVGGGLWQRFVTPRGDVEDEDRIGLGAVLAGALIGYFAWFGVVG